MPQDPHHCVRKNITNKDVLWQDLKFSHSGAAEDSCLLGYDVMLTGKKLPIFFRVMQQ
jgi:hypothetical protein